MHDDIALKVESLYKSFKLPHEKQSSIKGMIINLGKRKRGYEKQEVLKDISFEIRKGEFFGIVGRNGSGKSTLLKLIAGIYTPDAGTITVNGKLTPFIELGVGFNPDLTGRENVFLNGALLGFNRDEMAAMYEEIVEFAELERFMDQKLKNYSSGMQVRLAFSIAIRANTDILVLDEVLAVGDEAFQRKCNNFFDKIKKDKSKTVILVTHSMGSVKKYCSKALLIKDGEILISGNPDDVANQYIGENLETVKKKVVSGKYETGLSKKIPLLRNIAVSKKVVTSNDSFKFAIDYDYLGAENLYAAFSVLDAQRGGIVYDSGPISMKKGRQRAEFSMPLNLFNSSDFKIVSALRVKDSTDIKKYNMVAFTNENNSLFFSIRNKKEKSNYALINRDILKVEQIK